MDGILQSLEVIFSLSGLAMLVVGALLGIVIGALPGLGPSIGLSLLIPFTYNLGPELSMLLMISLYTSAEYGGSISAILLSTPGTAAAAPATAGDMKSAGSPIATASQVTAGSAPCGAAARILEDGNGIKKLLEVDPPAVRAHAPRWQPSS